MENSVTAIHLDAVGGVAGDMFVAALLDARPDLWPRCQAAIDALSLPDSVAARRMAHDDGTMTGSRFVVMDGKAKADAPDGAPDDAHHGGGAPGTEGGAGSGHGHGHVHWAEIRAGLKAAALDEGVRGAALAMFTLLAEAEARVHGKAVDEVSFHEVGAVDSLVDIVCAAAIVTALAPCRWSISPLPRGRGQVRTAHGFLPVPAPATMELLTGFAFLDDGEEGERITPTGAAILRYLRVSQAVDGTPRRLMGFGTGFGTRRLRSRSNILRASLYGAVEKGPAVDQVDILRCEIDDQTAEDLAVAINHLRQADGVIDVCQWPVFGKKGRMGTALQILVAPDRAPEIAALVLDETTSLGVRRTTQSRSLVSRDVVSADGLPVKTARRPSGLTAKLEMDSLAHVRGLSNRQHQRQRAERDAIGRDRNCEEPCDEQ